MWTSIISLCVVCSIFRIGAVPAPGHGALEGYCILNGDCNLDHHTGPAQCCVSFTLPGQNRTVDPGDVTRFVKGECKPFPYKNEECIQPLPYVGRGDDIHYVHCPCKHPYVCDGSGETLSPPVGRLGFCRPRCISSIDCASDECCVENNSLQMGLTSATGLCQPMGAKGAKCLQINGSGRPTGVVKHSCPCLNPYTCGNIIRPVTDTKQTATCGFFKG